MVGVVIAAVLSRLFSQEDYATYRQALLSYTFAAPFVILGLDRALFYFLPNEKERTRGVLVENLVLLAGGGLLLSLFLLVGGNHLLALRFNNPALVVALLLMVPYPLFMVPMTALNSCLLARDMAAQVAAYNILSRLFMLLAVVVPCFFFPTPKVAITGVVLGAGVASAIGMSMMFRACNAGDWRPTLGGFRKQLAFSVPLGLSTLVATVSRSLDQVFVAATCSTESFAVFVNGAIEIPLVGIITGSVTSVLIVDYAKLYKEEKLDEIVALIHRAMVKCGIILIPAMFFLLCTAPELMRLLYGARYEGSAAPFRVYLLILPIRTLTFGAILMATGNSRRVLESSLIPLIVKLAITWYAIDLLGTIGAPIVTVFGGYVLYVPYMMYQLRGILKCAATSLFPWSQLLLIVCISSFSALLILTIKSWLPQIDAIILSVTSIIYTVITVMLFNRFGFIHFADILKYVQECANKLISSRK
mgnify:CR=1 FL=1